MQTQTSEPKQTKRLIKFTVPPTWDQGSYGGICTKHMYETFRQNALSQYNSARAHDGLEPISRMPKGTQYQKV